MDNFIQTKHKNKFDFGLIIILISVLIFIFFYSRVNILKFKIFSDTSFGWWAFYMYDKLAQLHNPFNLFVLPQYNIAIFFFPINYLYAFIYNLYPRVEILFILQNFMLAIGAVPIYLMAKERLGSKFVALSFSISYLLHPVITVGSVLGYMPLSFGLPFLLFAFYYLQKGNFKLSLFLIIIAGLSKIDIVLMTLIFGLILAFSNDSGYKRYGITIFKISLIWLALVGFICIIYLNSIKQAFPAGLLHFDQYGGYTISAFKYFLNNPNQILNNFFNEKNMLISLFSFPLIILAICYPFFLIPVLPEVGFITIRNQHSTGHFLILGFVFLAAIYGAQKIINFLERLKSGNPRRYFINFFAIFMVTFSIIQHYYFKPKVSFSEELMPLPFSKGFDFDYYKMNTHAKIGHVFLKKIPKNSSCLVSQAVSSHLSKCDLLWLINREIFVYKYDWDYILVDLSRDDFYPFTKREFFEELSLLLKGGYGVIDLNDGWLLLKKKYVQNMNSEVFDYMEKYTHEK